MKCIGVQYTGVGTGQGNTVMSNRGGGCAVAIIYHTLKHNITLTVQQITS